MLAVAVDGRDKYKGREVKRRRKHVGRLVSGDLSFFLLMWTCFVLLMCLHVTLAGSPCWPDNAGELYSFTSDVTKQRISVAHSVSWLFEQIYIMVSKTDEMPAAASVATCASVQEGETTNSQDTSKKNLKKGCPCGMSAPEYGVCLFFSLISEAGSLLGNVKLQKTLWSCVMFEWRERELKEKHKQHM